MVKMTSPLVVAGAGGVGGEEGSWGIRGGSPRPACPGPLAPRVVVGYPPPLQVVLRATPGGMPAWRAPAARPLAGTANQQRSP